MIEQYTPIEEIPGLDGLVEHFRKEYGEEFLAHLEEKKLRIGISLVPIPTKMFWRRDQPSAVYELKAVLGYVVGYRFKGSVFHNRDKGTCHIPLNNADYVTITIVCNPSL